jgi:excisionase family DNA binding protein
MAQYTILSEPLREELKSLMREVLAEGNGNGNGNGAELFTPEQLAERMKLPVSWVYEQSRQGNIPTHRIGRYLRFSLTEVLESQKKRLTTLDRMLT